MCYPVNFVGESFNKMSRSLSERPDIKSAVVYENSLIRLSPNDFEQLNNLEDRDSYNFQ